MEKINVAEILKDCPTGMELDCTVYNDVTFLRIDEVQNRCYFKAGPADTFWTTCEGRINGSPFGKCVIFPKGKTTWEGFVPPCKFKDGDIIFVHTNALKCNLDDSWVAIFKEYRNNRCACYMCLCLSGCEFYHDKWEDELLCELCEMEESRLATEEEKQKLFQAIKDNGYKWDTKTKTLEKLIEPKFKVGNKIEKCGYRFTIAEVKGDYYLTKCGNKIPIDNQDDFSLVPNKFDVTTLKPFDKVLVRMCDTDIWDCDIFSTYSDNLKFNCICSCYTQCIPYEANKELLGTTKDCDDYFKNW